MTPPQQVRRRPKGSPCPKSHSPRYELSTFGAHVLKRRERLGITHARLAARAGIGINTLTYMIYRSPHSPSLYAMEWVAEALGVPLWQLLAPPGTQHKEPA